MGDISYDLRRRIVDAYLNGHTDSYVATAKVFGVGVATVNRLLRLKRETGDVRGKKRGGNNPRRVDLEWLERNAQTQPDARLVDRITAWQERSGTRVSIGAMWDALRAIGWTHKKRHQWRANVSGPTS